MRAYMHMHAKFMCPAGCHTMRRAPARLLCSTAASVPAMLSMRSSSSAAVYASSAYVATREKY